MKTIRQLYTEAQASSIKLKVPDHTALTAILDAVRKNNPALLSKAKAWLMDVSALAKKFPDGATGDEVLSALQMGEPGRDILSFTKGLSAVTSRDVYASLAPEARDFISKADKLVKQYNSASSQGAPPESVVTKRKTDWKPEPFTQDAPAPEPVKVKRKYNREKPPEIAGNKKKKDTSAGGASYWDKFEG